MKKGPHHGSCKRSHHPKPWAAQCITVGLTEKVAHRLHMSSHLGLSCSFQRWQYSSKPPWKPRTRVNSICQTLYATPPVPRPCLCYFDELRRHHLYLWAQRNLYFRVYQVVVQGLMPTCSHCVQCFSIVYFLKVLSVECCTRGPHPAEIKI